MRPIFYGWWLLAAGGLIFGTSAALSIFAIGTLYVPLEAEFGWSRGQLSTALSVSFGVAGLMAPFVGRLIDRLGPRVVVSVGGVILASSFVLLSFVTEFWQFAVVLLIIATGRLATTNLTINAMIVNWFVRQRSFALGLTRIGLSIGTLIGVPLTAAVVVSAGWRQAMLLNAAILFVVIVPLAALVLRRSPADMGLLPDGGTAPMPSSGTQRLSRANQPSITLRAAARTRAFWMISLAMICFFFAEGSLALHIQPFLASRGLNYQLAAAVGGAIPAAYLLGGLLLGPLSDRTSTRRVLAGSFILMAVATTLLWFVADSPFVWAFVPLFGMGAGAVLSLYAAFLADLFGVQNYGTILGVISMLGTSGVVIGPSLTGFLFDATGSYATAIVIFVVVEIIGGGIMLLARRPTVAIPQPELVTAR